MTSTISGINFSIVGFIYERSLFIGISARFVTKLNSLEVIMSRETLHLLLLTHDQNEAENIISLLRNSGKATLAPFFESTEDFTKQPQVRVWNLVIPIPQYADIKLQD